MAAYDLRKALGRITNQRFHFSLYRGETDDCVFISQWPAKGAQLAAVEAELGKLRRLTRGLVYWEENVLVFATKTQPSGAWEKMIVKLLKRNRCSTYLPLELRKLGTGTDDSGEAESGDD